LGSNEAQKAPVRRGFIQQGPPARWEMSMGCVLKLFNHETWLFIERTSEWIRLNSFYHCGAVGGLSISDMVRILMAKEQDQDVGLPW
jgi:hypothetical protein